MNNIINDEYILNYLRPQEWENTKEKNKCEEGRGAKSCREEKMEASKEY